MSSMFATSPFVSARAGVKIQQRVSLHKSGAKNAPSHTVVVAAAGSKNSVANFRGRNTRLGGGICDGGLLRASSLSSSPRRRRWTTSARVRNEEISEDDAANNISSGRVVNDATGTVKSSCDDEAMRMAMPASSPASLFVRRVLKVAAFAAVACAVAAIVSPDVALAASKKAAAEPSPFIGFLKQAFDVVHHLDKHLVTLFTNYGLVAYGILFAIIFCETGLVVTPILPGDSLLFAAGALGSQGVLNFPFLLALLFVAAVLGDTVNYGIGSFIGARIIEQYPKIFKKEYIEKTKNFYETYGGKTVVLARFFVIVRTFAPFVAGVAKMQYARFIMYNVVGGGVWVSSFMFLGYFFGQIPAVKENFALTVAGIVVLSLVPVIMEIVQHQRQTRKA